MKILISSVTRAQKAKFEQVSYSPVYCHICLIHASQLQLVTAFVFMTVIQSETCAPICLNGHLPIDRAARPTVAKPRPWRSIWSTFRKYGSPSCPPVLRTANIRCRYCSNTHRTNVKDYAKLQRTTLLFTPSPTTHVSAPEDCN